MRIDAVIIEAQDPQTLAAFYRDGIGAPLVEERHGPELHWGCDLDGLHFAIHAAPPGAAGACRIAISFAVESVDATTERLRRSGIRVTQEPTDRPYGRLAAVLDPEGNTVYLHR